jgi:hypothetical protein
MFPSRCTQSTGKRCFFVRQGTECGMFFSFVALCRKCEWRAAMGSRGEGSRHYSLRAIMWRGCRDGGAGRTKTHVVIHRKLHLKAPHSIVSSELEFTQDLLVEIKLEERHKLRHTSCIHLCILLLLFRLASTHVHLEQLPLPLNANLCRRQRDVVSRANQIESAREVKGIRGRGREGGMFPKASRKRRKIERR